MAISSIFNDPFSEHTFFGFISCLFATIIMIAMFIHFLYHDWIIQCKTLNIRKYEIWRLQPHTFIATLSLLFYIIFGIHQLFLASYGTFIVNSTQTFYAPYCIAFYHQNWGLFLGKTFMYLFWFVRFVIVDYFLAREHSILCIFCYVHDQSYMYVKNYITHIQNASGFQ